MRKTRASLNREIVELKAQLISSLTAAKSYIGSAGVDKLTGSGVLLQLTAIGGKEIIPPVMIRDGLGTETIKQLLIDIRRSYELATLHKV